ncbi:hypothetical protein GCM10022222_82890 [Amycolatopsis ultiminotia]|uniref:Uncharacterized protein n=1 Tax=Amycolatopsis ultiminotia TaxID=543629 RepID=A0ABP6YKV9_9PSEU
MNTRPVRVLLTVIMTGFLLVCLVFLLYQLHVPYPAGVHRWLADHKWLMWTAAIGTVVSSLALAPLTMFSRHPADDR